MLSRFDDAQQLRLPGAMHTIAELLDDSSMKYARPSCRARTAPATWPGSRAAGYRKMACGPATAKSARHIYRKGLCAGVATPVLAWPADGR